MRTNTVLAGGPPAAEADTRIVVRFNGRMPALAAVAAPRPISQAMRM